MSYPQHAAFSLSEVLVALFLGSLLASLALHQFVSIKKQFQYLSQTLHGSMEESLSIDLIRDSIFYAGFTPYGSIQHLQSLNTADARKITAIETLSAPRHGFITRRMDNHYVPLIRVGTNTISVPASMHIQKNDKLILCNWCCYQVLSTKNILRQNNRLSIEFQQPIHSRFDTNSFVGRWLEEQYEFKKNASKKTSALYYHHHHHNEVLVDKWTSFSIRKAATQKTGMFILLKDKQQKETVILNEAPNA